MDKHQGSIVVRSRCESPAQNGTVFMLFFPDHGVGRPAAEPGEQSAVTMISEQLA
jgi:hypothetical protein